MSDDIITVDRLLNDLTALGIRRGDRLAIHISYRAVGRVEGGPAAVVRALMQAVGESGTIVMPEFQDLPAEVFRVNETRSDCGIVTELFRKMPGVYRSLHPTHSAAVWGRDAAWMAAAHEEGRTALGVDCPFDRLAQRGGQVLLIGVGHNRNSMVHVGEAYAHAPYLPVPFSPDFVRPLRVQARDGHIFETIVEECPGCSENFGVVGPWLEERGLSRHGTFGRAPVTIMLGVDVIRAVADLLRKDPTILLCESPKCPFCPAARAAIPPEPGKPSH